MGGSDTYDYVIVGAGSAGCVLAARLSEAGAVRVLLLEAGGPDRRREIAIPAAFSRLFRTECDWAYTTEPEEGLAGRALYWPRGKVVGGSSSINAMIYMRGHPVDYDGWRDAGNPGWGWSDVLPYFLRAEDQARGTSAYHGVGGPLHVADQRCVNPLSRAFVEAGVAIGLPHNLDFNGPTQDGVGLFQVTQKGGRRWSAADAYLRPARARSNLTVCTRAHATRVVVERGRARGVAYLDRGRPAAARAEREVILSAGAVGSPQLLLLSGIGPADTLRAHGVTVVTDLPGVGQNLQDHPAIGVFYTCLQPVSLTRAERLGSLIRYLVTRTGPLTSPVAEAGAFVRTRAGLSAPDLQFHFGPAYFLDHGFTRPPGDGFSIGPALLRPESRGEVALRSSDPLVPPVIRPRYLTRGADRDVLREGVRLARRIIRARPFDIFRGAEVLPGPGVERDAEIDIYLRERLDTLYHPVGTCRMGPDAQAVVNASLQVRGVDGLRVVDASIMPTTIGGNANAPTIMIAEKAADLIRKG